LAIGFDGGAHGLVVEQQDIFVDLALALDHRAGLDFGIADHEILAASVPRALLRTDFLRIAFVETAITRHTESRGWPVAAFRGGKAGTRIVGFVHFNPPGRGALKPKNGSGRAPCWVARPTPLMT